VLFYLKKDYSLLHFNKINTLIKKNISVSFYKYVGVGSIAALVDISIFSVFAKLLGLNYLIVALVSFTIASFVNYILSIKYVFKSRARYSKGREIFAVYMVSFFGLVINEIVLYALIDLLFMEMIFAKVLATGIIFFWNYLIRKNYIF
jgi:putative flippase GtrA